LSNFMGVRNSLKILVFIFLKPNQNEPTLNFENCKLGFRGLVSKKLNHQFLDGFYIFYARQHVMLCTSYPWSRRPCVCLSVCHALQLYQNGAS